MYFYKEDLINLIVPDQPDPAAAKVLQETLGGRFGEMRTMMQFFFQSNNFRGLDTQFRDLIRGVFLEEISHVELVQHTINQLLTGAGADGAGNAGIDEAPLDEAVKHANPHHFGSSKLAAGRCGRQSMDGQLCVRPWQSGGESAR